MIKYVIMGKNGKRGEAIFFVIAGKIIQLKNQGGPEFTT
jgi:hypothetical protein